MAKCGTDPREAETGLSQSSHCGLRADALLSNEFAARDVNDDWHVEGICLVRTIWERGMPMPPDARTLGSKSHEQDRQDNMGNLCCLHALFPVASEFLC
jgi:hypothetical protein